MKNIISICFLLFLFSAKTVANEKYVVLWGDKFAKSISSQFDTICINNTEYTISKTSKKGILAYSINIPTRPWFKLGYLGKCSGLASIRAEEVELNNDLENTKIINNGIKVYNKMIKTNFYYDKKLEHFYQEIKEGKAKPKFKSVIRQWPLENGVVLREQCFTVSVNTSTFPSQNRDFEFAGTYRRSIIKSKNEHVLMENTLQFKSSYSESDEPQLMLCHNISMLTDINGNNKYEYSQNFEQPEVFEFNLLEFNGSTFEEIYKFCEGEGCQQPINSGE